MDWRNIFVNVKGGKALSRRVNIRKVGSWELKTIQFRKIKVIKISLGSTEKTTMHETFSGPRDTKNLFVIKTDMQTTDEKSNHWKNAFKSNLNHTRTQTDL